MWVVLNLQAMRDIFSEILLAIHLLGPPSSANSIEGSEIPLTQQQEPNPPKRPN